jgi:hypothetical protein
MRGLDVALIPIALPGKATMGAVDGYLGLATRQTQRAALRRL